MLLEADPERSFGQALVLALRSGASSLVVFVGAAHAGVVARQADYFEPAAAVWAVDGTTVTAAVPTPVEPASERPLAPHIASIIEAADVVAIVEHGELMAECNGLEVGRVAGDGDDQRLDVGVGAYDQGAFAVINPGLTPDRALAQVVSLVREHRRRGAEPHPLNRLVRERWLRAELIEEPASLGLASLRPVEATVARDGLYDTVPAFAQGIAVDSGERVVVACSVGIDLALIPAAVDVAAREHATRIIVVLPQRDQHAITVALAAGAKLPVEIVTADVPWS